MARDNGKKSANKKAANKQTSPDQSLEQGITAVMNGDRTGAEKIFQETTELYPDSADAWVWLGGTTQSMEAAQLAFERARSLHPDNEEASLGLRWIELRRNTLIDDIVGAAVPTPIVPEHALPAAVQMASASAATTAATATPYQNTLQCPNCGRDKNTLQCPNCGRDNSVKEKFCIECGQDLVLAIAQQAARGSSAETEASPANSSRRTMVIMLIIALVVLAGIVIWYLTR
jgi:hypothetical protein